MKQLLRRLFSCDLLVVSSSSNSTVNQWHDICVISIDRPVLVFVQDVYRTFSVGSLELFVTLAVQTWRQIVTGN